MDNLYEFKKTCKYCNKEKIAVNQTKCSGCQAEYIKKNNKRKKKRKKKRNWVDYICEKSGGILVPDDFKIFIKNKKCEVKS